ncbi:fibrinogen-like protein 1 [Elysia marginata]|uniref:Fibrinogen-like protein 1 n=1 Tax=Elysia marginata TaxID=1093978 RepID=A0AAV4F402_9GAST|nr:fibrinogen-like protein 1 [Elysia marginata]
MSDNSRAVGSLETQIRDITPVLPTLKTFSKDVGNIVKQVLPDCNAYFHIGYRTSGVYTIHPGTLGKTLRVFCVMDGQERQQPSFAFTGESTLGVPVQGKSTDAKSKKISQSEKTARQRTQTPVSRVFVSPDITGWKSTIDEPAPKDKGDQTNQFEDILQKEIFEITISKEAHKDDIDDSKGLQRKGGRGAVELEKPGDDVSSRVTHNTSKRKSGRRRRRRGSKAAVKDSTEKRNKKKRRRRDAILAVRRVRRRSKRGRKHRKSIEPANVENGTLGQEITHKRSKPRKGSSDETDSTDFGFTSLKPQHDAQIPTQNTQARPKTRKGGWTVIQRRRDGKVNFTQPWTQYAAGFGNVEQGEDYWLGNEALHHLTKREPLELKIVMEDVFSSVWEATYSRFRVAGRGDNYRIQLSGYHGNASDALGQCDRMTFSTVDRPGESGSRGEHCARYNGAGWWYPQCHVSNLNGPFPLGMLWFNNAWLDWVQIKTSLMMVRPQEDSMRWP